MSVPERVHSLKTFLESVPPGQERGVTHLTRYVHGGPVQRYILNVEDLWLYCPTEDICEGMRRFRGPAEINAARGKSLEIFLTFLCRNCSRSLKTFAAKFTGDAEGEGGIIYKFGETPNFGPPTPPRLTRLFGIDKDLFLKGRRAENQGLGIAAFAYYRRVIESQKDAIFDEILRVSRGVSADPQIIDELESAKKQTQFSSAVEAVKDAIPPILLISGHNPLTLLHSALSEGLHARTDEECLAFATDLRVVMTQFVERMAQAPKDNAELQSAVSRLLNRRTPVVTSSE